MSITLTVAEARVAKYLDDVDDVDASTADIDVALKVAHNAIYLQASKWAPERFAKEVSVSTNASGVADLTSYAPVRIAAVNYASGQSRFPIPAASLADGPTDALGVKTLKISYVPSIAFPAAGSDVFVWGQSALDFPILDDMLCLRAAVHLTALLDQPNKQLEAVLARTAKEAENILNFSAWKVMPLRGRARDSGFCYVMTDAVSLQLVTTGP